MRRGHHKQKGETSEKRVRKNPVVTDNTDKETQHTHDFMPQAQKPIPAKQFFPHIFQTTIQPMEGLPSIIIMPQAFQHMLYLVDIAQKEVGWFGTVTQEEMIFRIEEIFLFPQEVTHSINTISAAGLSAVITEVQKTRPQEEALAIWKNLRFWGHSHVRSQAQPSPQDVKQFAELVASSGHPWFIRGIANKEGELVFSIFLKEQGLLIHDVEWSVGIAENDELRARVQDDFTKKVTEKVATWEKGNYEYSYHSHNQRLRGIRKTMGGLDDVGYNETLVGI